MQLADIKEIAPILSGAIGALATLLAVGVTGFVAFRVAKLNINAQRLQRLEEMRLEKVEELYFLFDKWQINFSNMYLWHLRCYKGTLLFRDVSEMIKKDTFLAPGEAQKYRMILDVHFPSLRTAYAPVETARQQIVPFLSDPSESKLSAQDFVKTQVAFEKACEEFKSCIASMVQTPSRHVGRGWWRR
jgi:hypothetical protein